MKLGSIQFLRMTAALLIAYVHAIELQVHPIPPFYQNIPHWVDLTTIGIDIFFVMSGFIIAWSTARYSSQGQSLYFLKKRFFRLAPAYYIATLGYLIIDFHYLSRTHQLPDTSQIIKSIFLVPVADTNAWIYTILPVAWTLSFEWFFYLLFAFTMAVGSRYRNGLFILLGLIFVSAHYVLVPADYRLIFITNPITLEFIAGVVIYECYTRLTPAAPVIYSLLLAGLGLCMYQLFAGPHLSDPAYIFDGSLSLQRFLFRGIPAALLVAGCIFMEKKGLWLSLWKNRLVNLLGDASYSLYLTHYATYLLGEAAYTRWGPIINPDITVFVWLIFALLISIIFYRLVERPLLEKLKAPARRMSISS